MIQIRKRRGRQTKSPHPDAVPFPAPLATRGAALLCRCHDLVDCKIGSVLFVALVNRAKIQRAHIALQRRPVGPSRDQHENRCAPDCAQDLEPEEPVVSVNQARARLESRFEPNRIGRGDLEPRHGNDHPASPPRLYSCRAAISGVLEIPCSAPLSILSEQHGAPCVVPGDCRLSNCLHHASEFFGGVGFLVHLTRCLVSTALP
jgi:hypothetical protein